jgi:transcriptional regulator with XRE-family HTH domain
MPSLRDLRQQSGLTQAELAAKSGLRQATISALENGHTQPHGSTIRALSAALGVDAEPIRTALAASDSSSEANAIIQFSTGWPFLAALDPDLRTGLATSLVAEWTHSSTALEGNTITLGDTLFVLTEGLTISGKSLREHQELHGHSQALALMASWTRARRPIGIDQLHQLNRAVQTGTAIDSLAPVGRWKVEPNGTNAITTSGSSEWHDYAQPQHVPLLIEQWLKSLATHCRNPLIKSSPSDHQPSEAAKEVALDAYTDVHLGFTGIHPYADGNGRMARLLANIPILRAGLPPLLVPLSERRRYLALLGDHSLARGQPHPGEDLVPQSPERSALRDFFGSCWRGTHDLIEDYHQRQAGR